MKRIVLSLCCLGLALTASAQEFSALWSQVAPEQIQASGRQVLHPARFVAYHANDAYLKQELGQMQQSPAQARPLDLPMPDGSYRRFMVWETPIMEAPLAARYKDIKTYTGYALDNKGVTSKIDYTLRGFHAMITGEGNAVFIDPYTNVNDGYYFSYYKKDYPRTSNFMQCEVQDDAAVMGLQQEALHLTETGLPPMQFRINGATKKTYRLALACTGEYASAVTSGAPTKPLVLSAMVTSINRINSVYELELAVTLVLIANTDTLIFLDGTTDPYTNGNGGTMLGQNQTTVDAFIGTPNYDIGHVFSTGGGGIANLGCVCDDDEKAEGVTGQTNPVGDPFDIDYVAHEMGHQFSGSHTFTANSGSCNGNGSTNSSYEPGSGTTIMAYAGICGAGDNIAAHSDPFFHARSLDQIGAFISNINSGGSCPITSVSGNIPAVVAPFTATYSIPILTPFELSAPTAVDPTADTLLYSWEQYNRGPSGGQSWANSRRVGAIFRSFVPTPSPTRIFPRLDKILENTTSYLGEKLPDTERVLTFRLTTRDIFNGVGCFNFADDSIRLEVVYTGTPFAVILPNIASEIWYAGRTDTVTWDVSQTDLAPINCAAVDIYLSVDSGFTYPYVLATQVPNTGMAIITVPNVQAFNKCRVKVKGNGNVFFDLSNENFSVDTPNTQSVNTINALTSKVQVYPVPATEVLHITTTAGMLAAAITNAIGQQVWTGTVDSKQDVNVQGWSKGVYYIRLTEKQSGLQTVKPVVIQ